ncbi:hypothetical protein [Rhizomonospora bruguierae]|uniref:hypothetical protein n=1 Tax=Rhizomonospora bruguierae TaxID=1581705 RepID=UPI001BD18DC3|nr:hypothetical protein [Micromonospora sp. NBRC 107566]
MSSGRAGRRRLIVAAVAAWAVLVVAVGAFSAFRDRPTWKDQTTLAQAHRTLDAATGELLRAAGPAAVPALEAYEVLASCRITPARGGTNLRRTVRLFTAVGTEEELLTRIVAGLPPGYRAESSSGEVKSVFADAGNFVGLRGGPGDPGEVRFRISTDCRPGADPTLAAPVADAAGREPVQRALDLLGAAATGWRAFVAPCPGGGQARTVEAEAPPWQGSLAAALARHPGSGVLADAQRYAYRDGDAGVAVRSGERSLLVTATTGCPAAQ